MSIQFSTTVRNAMLDVVESTIGTAAILKIWSGTAPANCAASDTGTTLVSYTLASDWAAAASSGSKSFNNTPISGTASATGTATYFRIFNSAGTTCHWQGTVTATGGGGDMTLDNTSIASGQTVNVTSFTLNALNS
jgi:hypothetical protein